MNSPCSYQRLTCPPGLISLPSQAFTRASTLSHSPSLSPPLYENTCEHSDLPPQITSEANTYIQSFPCARHFTYINSFNLHKNCRRQRLVLSPFYMRTLEVLQLVSGKADTGIQALDRHALVLLKIQHTKQASLSTQL